MTGDMFSRPLADLLYSVQNGKTAFGKAFGAEIFDWLPHHQEEAAMFSDLMVVFHGPETAAVADAYDFSRFDTLVDVGGATGNMLTIRYIGRPERASPAEGYSEAHKVEQKRIVTEVLTLAPSSAKRKTTKV